jgi:copper/silver efflux system protein
VPVYLQLGSEFMPPLREGTILYMPSAVEPGMSVAEAQKALQVQDKILRTFPEVARVFGKAGRANTSTDPAPFTMMETTILLKPESDWRERPRWYSGWPEWTKRFLRPLWRDRISEEELEEQMNAALQLPGISNAWTMPIKGRLDMLSTGIRTPVGIKIMGSDLATIERIARETEAAISKLPATRSAYAERVAGGYFLDFVLKREKLARYGLSVDDANMMVMTAVGGDNQSTTVEGRERYGINVRYAREYREDLAALKRVLLPLPSGLGQIPMEEIADVGLAQGPSMIRDENGLLAGYVYVDFDTAKHDVGSFVAQAKKAVADAVKVPTGFSMTWSGQYENMLRVTERLELILPITLLLIFALLYLNTRSAFKASVVMLAVPFSAVGAVWLLWALGYNTSIAVWVGMIALMGLDAETGVFMLLFLDLSHDERKERGLLNTEQDLVEAIIHGAVKRVRPKAMTVAAAMLGLLPIMWSTGTGADLMKRIAAPMVGGLVTSFVMELLVYPAIYFLWKRRALAPV